MSCVNSKSSGSPSTDKVVATGSEIRNSGDFGNTRFILGTVVLPDKQTMRRCKYPLKIILVELDHHFEPSSNYLKFTIITMSSTILNEERSLNTCQCRFEDSEVLYTVPYPETNAHIGVCRNSGSW